MIGYASRARVGIRSSNPQHEPEVKTLASNHNIESTVVLGDEYDDTLRKKLVDVLRNLGATPVRGPDQFVVGSQDIEELDVVINGRNLHVETETYVGLSICGPADLVEQVRQLVLA